MRLRFEKKLKTLKNTILELGSECEHILESCEKQLSGTTQVDVPTVEQFEESVYQLNRSIDKQSFEILLRDQPMARDLFFVSTAPQLTRDLERIAEQGLEVLALLSRNIFREMDGELEISVTIKQLRNMLTLALDTYARGETDSFELLREKDNTVDLFFSQGKLKVIRMIEKNKENSSDILDAVILIKYLERIGDHIVSFAKWDGVAKRRKTSIV